MSQQTTDGPAVAEVRTLEALGLPAKVVEALLAAGIDTPEKLIDYSVDNPFTAINGIGEKGADEIKTSLAKYLEETTVKVDDAQAGNIAAAGDDDDDIAQTTGEFLDPEEPGISMGERGRRRQRLEQAQAKATTDSDEVDEIAPREPGEPEFVSRWRGHVLRLGPQKAGQMYPQLREQVERFVDVRDGRSANAIEDVFDQIRERENRRQAEDENFERNAFRRYARILERAENPQAGDSDELMNFAVEHDVSNSQMRSDMEIINRAKRIWPKHAALKETHAASIEARNRLNEIRKRLEEELEKAEREFHLAERAHAESKLAASELSKLSRQAPLFFEMIDGVPAPVWIDGVDASV